ncbi:hypothetical protein NC797_02945 [Aquibacillus sp. 3ASR75-11]|uniref:Uncharacterized protein n=1 Tax=Terrihalobacillus insolitus TaxID=2950438 RepID=A0A9X3WNW3_9BACI|nr:hypothetical protein [Terrihalobacillus insolitus]MDC3411859.1 hypothetical protein [Terrihalobacillus insolitus]MDC3423462.1 hypothetical protein [Terrihalobacillus insolitus]
MGEADITLLIMQIYRDLILIISSSLSMEKNKTLSKLTIFTRGGCDIIPITKTNETDNQSKMGKKNRMG